MIWRLVEDLDPPEFWPYGRLKVPKIENGARKNNVHSSLRPMEENPRRHEQDYSASKCGSFFINNIFHTNKKSLLAEITGLRRKKSELVWAINFELKCAWFSIIVWHNLTNSIE